MNNLKIIAAAASDWGIGKDGDLLFSIKQDMKFFRETTMDNVVVMGRKTLESFPGGRPLKNRVNIVFTRNKAYNREDVITVSTVDELFEVLKNYEDKKVFVIGGGEIYSLLLPYCNEALITKVNSKKSADTFINNFDDDVNWKVYIESEEYTENDYSFKFVSYKRI
ncbi:MAG: dihydrofolate reductase [Clostridia bacterium]|nr:dihydrofolate reductase [Clostridia bacterium]